MKLTIMALLHRLLLLIMLLATASCNPLETIEQRDAEGRLTRYQVNKQNKGREGLWQQFSADGNLQVEAYYLGDTLHGEKKYFYPGGIVESIENYQNGTLHGPFRKYYESGMLMLEQTYVQGAMQGLSIRYYPNGNVQERVTIVNNDENGPFHEYYENGNLKTEGTYSSTEEEAALEQGELREYDETGKLVRVADCVNGRCNTRKE
jgi:antitoxin component YwqK of YwqJK toxin-antitoxin module